MVNKGRGLFNKVLFLFVREVQPNGQVLVPLVPSSCCRVTSPDCGHLAWLQSNRSWTGLRPVDPSLLYTAGCAPAIARIFAIDLMLCRLLVLAVAALQVDNNCISRSCNILLGDDFLSIFPFVSMLYLKRFLSSTRFW